MRDFNHSVGVLVKAFFEGTLEHENCYACAVGNLITCANDLKYIRGKKDVRLCWDGFMNIYDHTYTVTARDQEENWMAVITGRRNDNLNYYNGRRKEIIDSTGYTVGELSLIEDAFEQAPFGNNDEEWMFNGLMAVVNVLAEIHAVDLTAKEQAKLLFVKATL